jgi:hypothetical protein
VGRAWLVFDPGAVEALRVKREAAKGHPWRGRAVVPKREKGVQ